MLRKLVLLLVMGLIVSAPQAATADNTFVFFGFVYQDPFCDHSSGLGLPGVTVTVFNEDMSVFATTVSRSEPASLLGYFHIPGLVEGNTYHYRFEYPGYTTVEGSFVQPAHDYKLRPCMIEDPLPVSGTTWGAVKALYK